MSDQDRISHFSLQYQYNIKHISDESKEKYRLGDYKLIQSQILQTNSARTVWQTVRRITNEILGVKGLRETDLPLSSFLPNSYARDQHYLTTKIHINASIAKESSVFNKP